MGIDPIESPPPAPLPLEYHAPNPSRPPSIAPWIWQYIHWTMFAAVVWLGLGLVPSRFHQIFSDFKVSVPAITAVVIKLSWALRTIWGAASLVVICMPMPVVIYAANGKRLEGEGVFLSVRMTRRLLTLAAILITGAIALALLLPYTALIDAVSGHK